MNKSKAFDCVAIKRAAAQKIQAQTQGMSIDQELAFWRKQEQAAARRGRKTQKPLRV